MKNRLTIPTVLALFFLSSCGNNQTQTEEEKKENLPEVCTYTYDMAQTKMNWTAYKFTERAGVKGSFDTLTIAAKEFGNSIPDLLTGAGFTIPIASINSNEPIRDPKIRKFFFGSLNSSTHLKGKVADVVGDDTEGSLTLSLSMNEMEAPVSMMYMLSGDTLIITGTMDVKYWNAQAGISALNKECQVLHTGKDGKSILWPDIKLELRSIIKKTCE